MSDELRPCPFCGKPPETFRCGENNRAEMIQCMTDGCVNPHVSYYREGVAREKWNRRAAHQLDGPERAEEIER